MAPHEFPKLIMVDETVYIARDLGQFADLVDALIRKDYAAARRIADRFEPTARGPRRVS